MISSVSKVQGCRVPIYISCSQTLFYYLAEIIQTPSSGFPAGSVFLGLQ